MGLQRWECRTATYRFIIGKLFPTVSLRMIRVIRTPENRTEYSNRTTDVVYLNQFHVYALHDSHLGLCRAIYIELNILINNNNCGKSSCVESNYQLGGNNKQANYMLPSSPSLHRNYDIPLHIVYSHIVKKLGEIGTSPFTSIVLYIVVDGW